MNTAMARRRSPVADVDAAPYEGPSAMHSIGLWRLLDGVRLVPASQTKRLTLTLPGLDHLREIEDGPELFYAGRIDLVRRKCVAIVGARKVSVDGAKRARRLARELVEHGIVVVSGLAEGVDTAAHEGALEAGGDTVAVIGTPLDKAYPAFNKRLQERIHREHLLVSPFPVGAAVYKSNFPQRNRTMAAISDATVIIEASDTSGSLHQAAECQPGRLDRWLFIGKSVVDDPNLTWPKRFIGQAFPKARVLNSTEDILAAL